MAPFYLKLWLLLQIVLSSRASNDDGRWSLISTVTREKVRLEGHLIKSFPAASQITCCHYCAKNTRCLSINYKKYQKDLQGRCELNSAGLSNDLDDKYLISAKGFVFSQIRCREEDQMRCPNTESVSSDFSLEFPVRNGNGVVFNRQMDRVLREFTLCFRMKTQSKGTVFSYALENESNEILIIGSHKFRFYVGGEYTVGANITVRDGEWHHVCATWRNTDGQNKIYIDGTLAESGRDLKADHVIEKGGVVVLGQEQDSLGGDFDVGQSFVGMIADLNLWDAILPMTEILEMSRNCFSRKGNVLGWEQFRSGIRGEVKIHEPSLCEAP